MLRCHRASLIAFNSLIFIPALLVISTLLYVASEIFCYGFGPMIVIIHKNSSFNVLAVTLLQYLHRTCDFLCLMHH